ncbi:hypothetical protein [Gaoshiqia sp. Z1-71]|uniref:hypothetical protein n=1 Tax=Gaoshiqia hydrogeniformans TaxID=3290090 RepID=UPI003BF79E13
MKISRLNYEPFFIDYTDGNLPPGLVDEFLDFLEENPDLAEELKAVHGISLPKTEVTFPAKEKLLKTGSAAESGFDYRLVAYIEGDLSEAEQSALLDEIARDPEKQKTVRLFEQIRLRPDAAPVFPDKSLLLKKKSEIYLYPWFGRVAAILLLGLLGWYLWPDSPDRPAEQQIVRHLPETSVPGAPVEKPAVIPEEPIEKQPAKITAEPAQLASAATTARVQPLKPAAKGPEMPAEEYPPREPAPEPIPPMTKSLITDRPAKPVASVNQGQSGQNTRDYLKLDEYLAHKILNTPKGENISFSNLVRAGLHAAENISNERFALEENNRGEISGVNFQSRLIAFSIPVKKNK